MYDPRMPMGLMGHDYHGIVIREAQRLWVEQSFNDRSASVQQYFVDSIVKANENQQLDMQRVNEYATNLTNQKLAEVNALDFIKNRTFWMNKARKMIAVDKVTMDNEGALIQHGGVIYRPVDKRENYIKRCVAIPGDVVEIKKSVLYINGKPGKVAQNQNLQYIASGFVPKSTETMREVYGLEQGRNDYYSPNGGSIYIINATASEIKKDVRRAVVLKFNTLYYRVNENNVEILSFFSNRQNPKKRKLK